MRWLPIFLIRVYRVCLSPIKNFFTFGYGVCRFHPSCSQYALESFQKYGVILGFKLTLKRLSKCHPAGGFGLDPVPTFKMIEDQKWMNLAIKLARKGIGKTDPNPIVGAVIVFENTLLGSGYHQKAGAPHAEPNAIKDALERGFSTEGATIYVTLEPCSTTGKTPPCTEAIIQAGIKRVVIGTHDPNPLHKGKAKSILQRSGIEVEFSTEPIQTTCFRLNPQFNKSFCP